MERTCAVTGALLVFFSECSVFFPHDVMRKRDLCCRPVFVRSSVNPSVMIVYYIQTAKDIVDLLSQPSSPIILPQSQTNRTLFLPITLANVDGFSKFFHDQTQQ